MLGVTNRCHSTGVGNSWFHISIMMTKFSCGKLTGLWSRELLSEFCFVCFNPDLFCHFKPAVFLSWWSLKWNYSLYSLNMGFRICANFQESCQVLKLLIILILFRQIHIWLMKFFLLLQVYNSIEREYLPSIHSAYPVPGCRGAGAYASCLRVKVSGTRLVIKVWGLKTAEWLLSNMMKCTFSLFT